MATQKIEIISLVIIVSSLLVTFFILDTANIVPNHLGATIFNALIYLTTCLLIGIQISALKWRIGMIVLSLGSLALIICNHIYIIPWGWDFVSRLIFGIDTVAVVAFVTMNLSHDPRNILFFTAFTVEVVLLIQHLVDAKRFENYNMSIESYDFSKTFRLFVSLLVCMVLVFFHAKKLWNKRWKVTAIASTFSALLGIGIILHGHWYYTSALILTLIVSINICLSFGAWLWLMYASKMKAWVLSYHEQEAIQGEQDDFIEMAELPTRFTIKDLETATQKFQEPIGEGGSGAVFKGTLADGSTVAVKRIKGQPSGELEFKTEITIIASLQHVNLVRLLGYCISPKGDRHLIYPFFENGSLDAWLFKDNQKRNQLTWLLRRQIAIDVAKALAYLHHECRHRILHLDIKPANILLDGNFRALVSDFGISKLIGRDESSVMTRARGTIGYLAPEVLLPNGISTKADVYSYGMVLLELIGGRRNIIMVEDSESQPRRCSYFPKTVREKMMQGQLMEVVDESLKRNEEFIREEEVTVLVHLALWCIQENLELRPNMIEVVGMLEGHIPVHLPPESSMLVLNLLDMESASNTAPKAREDDVTNMLTVSVLL